MYSASKFKLNPDSRNQKDVPGCELDSSIDSKYIGNSRFVENTTRMSKQAIMRLFKTLRCDENCGEAEIRKCLNVLFLHHQVIVTYREARVTRENGEIDRQRVGVQASITRGVSRVGWNRGEEALFITTTGGTYADLTWDFVGRFDVPRIDA
ncbi:hypothetical protein EAF00_003101 [Botryotinia globosa]|nr:hypothetical protein EAF00_003101 [Botryotinia globosa]